MSGPQEAAVTVGYVAAARAPSLTTPSLADAAGDAVDAAALEFLIWAALKTLEQIERSKQASWRKKRKEAAKKEKEASSSQRRRKKRKKKKKPGDQKDSYGTVRLWLVLPVSRCVSLRGWQA